MSDETPQPSPGLETGETGTDVSTQALTQALRGGFVILYIVIVILAGYFLFSNFSRVESGQRSVVLRFGRPLQTSSEEVLTEGKMVWAWPFPIDEKVDISGGELNVISTVGWYGSATGTNPQFNTKRDGYVLTRDWNILHIQAELHYKVKDFRRYNFEYLDVEKVLRCALDNAIVVTAAGYEVEDILEYKERPVRVAEGNKTQAMVFEKALLYRLKNLVKTYDLGVELNSETFKLTVVLPRGEVANRDKELRQARGSAKLKITKAVNDARKEKEDKAAKAEDKIRKAKADAKLLKQRVNNEFAEFNSLWKNYGDNPEGLQLELEKRLRDTIRGILDDDNVEITKLPAGPNGGRPRAKLIVRRLPAPKQKARDISKGGN